MIGSTLSFVIHIAMTSYRTLGPVSTLLQYLLPQYRNMATKAVKGAVNVNTKHLKKGDALPPFEGKIRVYNMRYCPYAQRTILALNAKKIDYEVVNINLMDKPEWLNSKSPLGKVPSLEIKENEFVYESLVTVEYLDDVFPERRLFPTDPFKKAYDKIIVESIGPIQSLMFKAIKFPETVTEENIVNYLKSIDFIYGQLISRGTTFLDGSEPGYADYMIWPWFERILAVSDEFKVLKIDEEKYKALFAYFNKMLDDPAVSQYLVSKEIWLKFLEAYKTGNMPNYELLTEN